MSIKKVKPKRKISATRIWAIIVSGMLVLAIIGLCAGVFVIYKLLQDKPVLNPADFEQVESSVVYDSKGEAVANLGTVIRQNIEYAEIPNCVVDAFVAIEDSRYFEHNGFDIPRFTKAILENLRNNGITEYALVEQDDCNGESPFACLKRSLDYLRNTAGLN